jgi:hypothetical protein
MVARASSLAATIALLAAAASCTEIVGVPDRDVGSNLACEGGECTCVSGFGDCDGAIENGCEVDLSKDPHHCGACGARCEHGVCSGATCACNEGFADCDATATDRCATNLVSDPANCGACGHSCLGGFCDGGSCQPNVIARGAHIQGPVSAGGKLVFVDDTTGDLFAGDPEGADFPKLTTIPFEGITETIWDLASGETSVFVAIGKNPLFDSDVGRVVSVDLSTGAISTLLTKAFPEAGFAGLAATSDAVFYLHRNDVIRIDRVSGEVETVSTNALQFAPMAADGVGYWTELDSTVRAIGPDKKLRIFWEAAAIVVPQQAVGVGPVPDVFPLVVSLGVNGLWRVNNKGYVEAKTPEGAIGHVARFTMFEGSAFFVDDFQGSIAEWDLGSNVTVLTDGQPFPGNLNVEPTGLVVDDRAVFYSTFDGDSATVVRLAR